MSTSRSIRDYFHVKDGLPDPRGSLSSELPSQAIARANEEVEKVLRETGKGVKRQRGKYNRYSPSVRAAIGKYASQHGIAATARFFSRKLGHSVSETTAYSLKKAYLQSVREKRTADDDGDVRLLPMKKRGRPVLLGEMLDTRVQQYLRRVREAGGVVSARIAMAAARGIMLSCNRSRLAEFGGDVELNRQWAYSLLKRMKFVKRKATTAKSKHSTADFTRLKQQFLADVVTTVEMEEIPAELILNWDQTGIKIVPSSTWTMEAQGSRRVEAVGVNDKRLITAVFCGSLTGDFLPVQVIYQGTTDRCHPRYQFPSDWDITHSPKHWSNEQTMVQYVENIIIPYVAARRASFEDETPALVIMDNFKGQITSAVTELLEANNIHVVLLPPNTTDSLQPMDLSVNKPAKDFLKQRFEEWYSGEVTKQLDEKENEATELEPINLGLPMLKELGAKWLVQMSEYFADNPHIIVNGFIRAGITSALDHSSSELEELQDEDDSESDFRMSDEEVQSDFDITIVEVEDD